MTERARFIEAVREKWVQLSETLNERARRLWAAVEANQLGHGGIAWVAEATGLARSTIGIGRRELKAGRPKQDLVVVRRRGAGRKRIEARQPELVGALEHLVSPTAQGDPEGPLRWTSKSTANLSDVLKRQGFSVSPNKVGQLLKGMGFSLQGNARMKEGESHQDRDAQFQHINELSERFIARGVPVVSVDTKKKELVGDFANKGREWRPKGKPIEVLTYDLFEKDKPKAIPYGVYDVAGNHGFVNVGTDHDTPTFAAHSLKRWWELLGKQRYSNATELFVTADAGGSNASQSLVWKVRLQELANTLGLTIHVSHFPPGTSKWNKIEHRLFSFISMNWRGKPLSTYETIIALISGTKTKKGLEVTAELDKAQYPVGVRVDKTKLDVMLNIERDSFHGEWNYSLLPFSPDAGAAPGAKQRRKPVARAETRENWKRLFVEQSRSGLNHWEFCKSKNINASTYYSARIRLVGATRRRTKRTAEEWKRLFNEQARSDLTHAAFCSLHSVEKGAYNSARRRHGDLKLIRNE